MYAVEITPDFVQKLRDNNNRFALDGGLDPVGQFSPPRPWHPEKYKLFLERLVAQAPKK